MREDVEDATEAVDDGDPCACLPASRSSREWAMRSVPGIRVPGMSDFGDAIDRRLAQRNFARDQEEAQRRRAVAEKEQIVNEVSQMCRDAVDRLASARVPGVPVVRIPHVWGFRGSVQRDADRVAWSVGTWTLTSTFDLWTDRPRTVAEFAASDVVHQRRIIAAFKRSGFRGDDVILPSPEHPLIDLTQYREGFGVPAPGVPGRLLHLPINDGALSVVPLDDRDRGLTVPLFFDIFAEKVATRIDD